MPSVYDCVDLHVSSPAYANIPEVSTQGTKVALQKIAETCAIHDERVKLVDVSIRVLFDVTEKHLCSDGEAAPFETLRTTLYASALLGDRIFDTPATIKIQRPN